LKNKAIEPNSSEEAVSFITQKEFTHRKDKDFRFLKNYTVLNTWRQLQNECQHQLQGLNHGQSNTAPWQAAGSAARADFHQQVMWFQHLAKPQNRSL
jgi:hypothetical protein